MLMSLDLVGVPHPRVKQWKARIAAETGVPADAVIISSTHTHSGPDTIGIWGPLLRSGLDADYLATLGDRVVECARKAVAAMVPATLAAGTATVDVIEDTRAPDVRNDTLGALVAYDAKGKPLALVANVAAHPEILGSKNRSVSSDYAHDLREALERDFAGAVAIYVQADCGGMQTPKVAAHTFDEAKRVGEALAAKTKEALSGAAELKVTSIVAKREPVVFALENRRFQAGVKAKIFGDISGEVKEEDGKWRYASEVVAIRLGDAVFVSVPGEALPEVGNEVRAVFGSRFTFLVGLGNDEIGYILPKADFDPKKYEESMSLGPETAPALLEAVRKLK
jgi:hypothetical protein